MFNLILWKQTGASFNLKSKTSFDTKKELVKELMVNLRLGSVTRNQRNYMVILRDER